MKITIDLDQIKSWVEGADKITVTPEAEGAILNLYKVADQIELAIKEAKERIKQSALELTPDFKSVHGDNLSVAFRAYGSRFKIDESYLNTVPKELYKVKTTISPVPTEVEKFADAHDGKLPMGIIEMDREKQLVITVKKGLV